MTKEVVVLGGGLAGLSTAWHLQKKGIPCQVFEKEAEPGGLCRSKTIKGFTFDYSGHLLHFRNDYSRNLVRGFLGENITEHQKEAWIYSFNRFTRYPFQINLYGLPKKVINECLCGFKRAVRDSSGNGNGHSFNDWVMRSFGSGIARHFMLPYNEKFWTVSPGDLTCEWLDGFVPVPTSSEIENGARCENKKPIGYNAVFYYPKRGGIQDVVGKLCREITGINTRHKVKEINLKEKKVYFQNGKTKKYDTIIYSMPLPEILKLCKDLPLEIRKEIKSLRHTSIFNLNLGVGRKDLSEKHWIYFPEKKFIFFRVGFPSNFSDFVTPPGTSSLYAEAAYSSVEPIDKEEIRGTIIKDLFKSKILKPSDKIIAEDINDIKYGYIIYDEKRKSALPRIKDFLNNSDIFTTGRYGSWGYMSMEDVLLDGRRIAESVSNN